MNGNSLLLLGATIAFLSGLPGGLLPKRSNLGQAVSTLILLFGNAIAGWAAIHILRSGSDDPIFIHALIPGAVLQIQADAISAFFVLPIVLITSLSSIYGLQYWKQSTHMSNGRRVGLFLGMMTGAMIVLVAAHDGLLFLAAWETMAVSALFLVAAEDQLPETRRAAWLYIAASHVATLCAFGVFALIYATNGTWEFRTLASPVHATTIAVLTFVGFGTKAGVMPFHVWLPSAHAQAPSHVSAIMSGVMIKMGIYGIVRVATFMPHIPLLWGIIVLFFGIVSAVLGVAFAIAQHDIKRLLAYHSIENIGIIVIGIGLALVGRATNHPIWMALGIAGGMLHVWNHALFKSLLFFGAGATIHTVESRELDIMGGLAKRMPWTAACFLVGSAAICGLPPFNGFISEFAIYLGIFRVASEGSSSLASLTTVAAPALALVGALAVACFVKVFGVVFLGSPRSKAAASAHEAGSLMLGPMIVLSVCCAAIGAAPWAIAPVLDDVSTAFHPGESEALQSIMPLKSISTVHIFVLIAMTSMTAYLLMRARSAPRSLTWDCGYAAPSPRMQYTASSFAEMLVHLFRWVLQPEVHLPRIREFFPRTARFSSHVEDTVLRFAVQPAIRFARWLFGWGRYIQNGSVQAYLVYFLVVIVFLMLWR